MPGRIPMAGLALVFVGAAFASGLEELRDTHERRIEALNSGHIDVLIAMQHPEGVAFGGHSPFPLDESLRKPEERERDYREYEEGFEKRTLRQINPHYRVIGNTGLAWGHVAITVKPKDGPRVTEFRRFTHVYVNTGGEWQLVLQHSSPIPSENLF